MAIALTALSGGRAPAVVHEMRNVMEMPIRMLLMTTRARETREWGLKTIESFENSSSRS